MSRKNGGVRHASSGSPVAQLKGSSGVRLSDLSRLKVNDRTKVVSVSTSSDGQGVPFPQMASQPGEKRVAVATERRRTGPDGTVRVDFQSQRMVKGTVRAFYPTGRIFDFPCHDYFGLPPSFKGSPLFSFQNPRAADGFTLFAGDPRGVYVDMAAGDVLYDPVTALEESNKYLDAAAADWLATWMDTYSGGGDLWPGKIAQHWQAYPPTLTFEQALCPDHEHPSGTLTEEGASAGAQTRIVHSVEIGPYHDAHLARPRQGSGDFQPDAPEIVTAGKPLDPGRAMPEAYSQAVELALRAASLWRSRSGLTLAEDSMARDEGTTPEIFVKRMQGDLELATPHWVAPETLTQIEMAALLFPPSGRLHVSDVPLARSWIAFSRPLTEPFAMVGQTYAWRPIAMNVIRGTYYRSTRHPERWPAGDERDEARGLLIQVYADVGQSSPRLMGVMRWLDGDPVDQLGRGVSVDRLSDATAEIVRENILACGKFLAAFYAFISQKLVVTRDGATARATVKREAREGRTAPSHVRVIHLRQTAVERSDTVERDPSKTRTEPDHRWYVRPHWMRLRHPRYAHPRDLWIGVTTNGPRGKPLTPPPAYIFQIDR